MQISNSLHREVVITIQYLGKKSQLLFPVAPLNLPNTVRAGKLCAFDELDVVWYVYMYSLVHNLQLSQVFHQGWKLHVPAEIHRRQKCRSTPKMSKFLKRANACIHF